MSAPRKPGARPIESARGHRAGHVASLRRRIGAELHSTEQVVSTLSRELAEYRRENRELARDRERLQERLAQVDVVRLEQADTETLWRSSLRERQRVEERLRDLEEANHRLLQQCVDLEEALNAERERADSADLEIQYLEEHIAELHSIIELLTPEADDKPED